MEIPQVSANHRVRFRAFELDPHTRELFRDGLRVKLQGQPIDVLEMLLERPGELVTREELRKKLWPEHTFVDFEHGLNSTVRRLREALGDEAERPRFIETLPKLGYRFICAVEHENSTATTAEAPPRKLPTSDSASAGGSVWAETAPDPARSVSVAPAWGVASRRGLLRIAVFALVAVVAGLLQIRYLGHPLAAPRIGEVKRITDDPTWMQKRVVGTDGSRVLLALDPPAFGQVQMEGGEISKIPIKVPAFTPSRAEWVGSVSPDGNCVLIYGGYHDDKDWKKSTLDLWVATTTGSSIRHLTRTGSIGNTAAWSPDGKQVVYSLNDGRIFTIPSAGGEPHLLRTLEAPSGHFVYSPDGKKLRFLYTPNGARRIWEMSGDGTDLHELFPNWRRGEGMYPANWTPDGSFFLFLLRGEPAHATKADEIFELWATDERKGKLRRANRGPIQLEGGPTSWLGAVPTRDSRTIFSQGRIFRGELVRYSRKTKQLEPYLNGRSAEVVSFSRDGKYVAYSSYPDGVLFRAKTDGTEVQQIGRAPHAYPSRAELSPDGNQIVFTDVNFETWVTEAYVMSAEGGKPVRLVPDDRVAEVDPTWSPDGKKVAYWTWPEEGKTDPEIRILDLATRQITLLPRAPRPVWSPRWSPDGRYMLCTTFDEQNHAGALELFDFNSRKWRVVPVGPLPADWPSWSRDSRSIFWSEWDELGVGLFRISVDGDRPERLTYLPGFRSTGWMRSWAGLDQEDNPLLLRDAGSTEVYALTLEQK